MKVGLKNETRIFSFFILTLFRPFKELNIFSDVTRRNFEVV